MVKYSRFVGRGAESKTWYYLKEFRSGNSPTEACFTSPFVLVLHMFSNKRKHEYATDRLRVMRKLCKRKVNPYPRIRFCECNPLSLAAGHGAESLLPGLFISNVQAGTRIPAGIGNIDFLEAFRRPLSMNYGGGGYQHLLFMSFEKEMGKKIKKPFFIETFFCRCCRSFTLFYQSIFLLVNHFLVLSLTCWKK